MTDPDRIAALRRFNRFYTARIGLLRPRLHDSGFGLTEARVLFELAQAETTSAGEIAAALALDPGYLSRILARFQGAGLLVRAPVAQDRRRLALRLTPAGRAAFAPLNAAAAAEAEALLAPLPDAAQAEVIAAMDRIADRLARAPAAPVVLRPPAPGDIGWVIARHGALYAAEYGLDARFEALVARVAGDFLANSDPAREAGWIAATGGVPLGSVFVVRAAEDLARLRLLLVEPAARGRGLGRMLVREALRFARAAGYRRITLWTQEVLVAARRIYAEEGFRLVSRETHDGFGVTMVGEEWERALDAPPAVGDPAPITEGPPR